MKTNFFLLKFMTFAYSNTLNSLNLKTMPLTVYYYIYIKCLVSNNLENLTMRYFYHVLKNFGKM